MKNKAFSVRRSAFSVRRAFSVVEILVAMAVLVVLVLMSSKLFDLISSAWTRQEAQSDVFISAQTALDYMSKEIISASAAANDNRNADLTLWQKDAGTCSGTTCDKLFFVAPVAPSDKASDLAEINYTLQYPASANSYTAQLQRSSTYYSSSNWDVWDKTPTSIAANTSTSSTTSAGGWCLTYDAPQTLSYNVWSLQISCFDSTGALQPTWNSKPGTATTGSKLPTAVQIIIKVYDDRTAAKVQAGSLTPASGNWASLVGTSSRTFSTWVYLPSNLSNN